MLLIKKLVVLLWRNIQPCVAHCAASFASLCEHKDIAFLWFIEETL